ncbi:hypothetical protein QUC31_005867 [Theobroma cacao]
MAEWDAVCQKEHKSQEDKPGYNSSAGGPWAAVESFQLAMNLRHLSPDDREFAQRQLHDLLSICWYSMV